MIVGATPVGLRLIGGELMAWPDLEHGPARGATLAALLRRLPPLGRVLVAGPHAVDLVAQLADRHPQVTCAVRSHVDGITLAEAFGGRVEVLCGSLAKLEVSEAYDIVIALDGVERLVSTEGAQLTWPESLRALFAAVRPGGSLLLAVPNPFGVTNLASTVESGHGSPWLAAGEASYGRPGAPGRLREAVREAGARVDRLWAGYAVASAPAVLVRDGALDGDLARGGLLDAPLAAAFARALAGAPLLMDPRRLVAGAVRAGLGLDFAPLWIVEATQRGAAPLPRGESEPDEPDAIISDGSGPLALTVELSGASGEWRRQPVGGPARGGPVEVGGVRRDPAGVATAPPLGENLAVALLDACAAHNIPRLRRLLAQWCALAAANPLATADGVVVTPDGPVAWDPSWSMTVPVRADVAAARCVRHLAATIVESGHPHPWPAARDADALAIVLGGLAGQVFDRGLLLEAVALEVVIRGALLGLDAPGREALARRLARIAPGTPPADLRGLRELHATVAGLRRDLDDAGAKLAWYERRLTTTEAALRDARIEAARRGPLGWLFAPVRRLVRAALRRAGLLSTARQFKRRLRWRI